MELRDKTIAYYDQYAKAFSSDTIGVDFTQNQNLFLKEIVPGGKILDFGCGAGRDAKYFLEQGYEVEATDGSRKMCDVASQYTGLKVKQMLFQALNDIEIYDGIWACSSILHLPKEELKQVMLKMARAVQRKGIIYTSFKYGEFEGVRNGRFFTDFTEDTFHDFMRNMNQISIESCWITADVRPGREEEKWLNAILRKV